MIRKLKPDRGIQGIIPAILSLVIFFFVLIIFGYSAAFKTLGSVILIYSVLFGFWTFYKTGNTYFLVSGFYLIAFSLVLFFIDVEGNVRNPEIVTTTETKLSLFFVYFF